MAPGRYYPGPSRGEGESRQLASKLDYKFLLNPSKCKRHQLLEAVSSTRSSKRSASSSFHLKSTRQAASGNSYWNGPRGGFQVQGIAVVVRGLARRPELT